MTDPAQVMSKVKSPASLKTRLGIGAALLGAGTLLTALILWMGMSEVARRLDTALSSEVRVARYATLSRQAATFLVVSTEAVQTGLPVETRMDRIAPVADQLRETFFQLGTDVENAVAQARDLGLDEQSRYGTQSLGLARMQAMLDGTIQGLRTATDDKARLRAYIDTFASQFDPLLSQAVNTELLFRNQILAGIDGLRLLLTQTAFVIAALTLAAVAAFYFGLVRPQFRRLDRLRDAAHRIAEADFATALPTTRNDEIGQLYTETNRMAAALAGRAAEVEVEWARLNATIQERTEALRAANTTLSRIDEDRRAFFADISHELRTPLTVILMEAQIGGQIPGDTKASFDVIHARAARLNRRIDDLLRIARSETGQLALDPQSVTLPDLLSAVVEEVRAEVANAGMTLKLSDVPDLRVFCDPNWMRQVLVSLVRNAIRHAREGRVAVLAAEATDTHVTISVADDGPGIPVADQDRIFERFVQGGAGNSQGFGVGLALARWIVEAHEGDIRLTSPRPKDPATPEATATGTLISLRLPVESP